MPDFDLGIPGAQDLLEWIDQPPPQQARDTHAIHFVLVEPDEASRTYHGFMFFRPGNIGAFFFRDQPGLSGVGSLVDEIATHDNPGWVRVEVRFRKRSGTSLQVFATLRFIAAQFPDPSSGTLIETNTHFQSETSLFIEASPRHWNLNLREKTTVLYTP